jgi:predicted metal-dependent phosphoesterase TrpH
LHTHYSDGADSPETVAARAAELGASAIAITDHDTLAALPEAAAACEKRSIEFLPGVEISSRAGSRELHILGLGVDPRDDALTATLARMAAARADRGRRMVERLSDLGVPIEWDDVAARAGGVVGRMHIAQAVVATGHATAIQDAFDKFLKAGKPAYVPREVLSPRETVDAIHAAGGLAFVAHPGVGDLESRLDTLLSERFDGIEVFHSKHAAHQQQRFAALAAERGLMISGGSDCHGNVKGDGLLMGRVRVPYAVYAAIRDRLNVSGQMN